MDRRTEGQMSLFDCPTYNLDADIAREMCRVVDRLGYSREQVVDRMNRLAGKYGVRLNVGSAKSLTVSTLEKWMNENEPGRVIPLRALVIFCGAVGDCGPFDMVAQVLGVRMIGAEEIAQMKYGRAILEEKEARRRRRKLEKVAINGGIDA